MLWLLFGLVVWAVIVAAYRIGREIGRREVFGAGMVYAEQIRPQLHVEMQREVARRGMQ